jgi:hypothetical protein
MINFKEYIKESNSINVDFNLIFQKIDEFSNKLKTGYEVLIEMNNRTDSDTTKPEPPIKKLDIDGNLVMKGGIYVYHSGEGKDDFEVKILNLNMKHAPDKVQAHNIKANTDFPAFPNKLELSKTKAIA